MVETRHLEHFMAVVDAGGFRRAAAAISLSAPALTRSVQIVEEHFGAKLLERTGKRVRPTPEGEVVAREARDVLARIRRLPSLLGGFRRIESGIVRVGVSPVIADLFLADAIGRMLADHPSVVIDVTIETVRPLLQEMLAHRLDLIVAFTPPVEARRDVEIRPLYEDSPSWWIRSGHPLANRRDLTPGDVGRFPIVHQHLPPGFREWFLNLFGESTIPAGTDPAQPGCDCETYDVLYRIITCSNAIGAFGRRNGRRAAALHGFRELDFQPPAPRVQMGIITARGVTLPPAAKRFIEFLELAERTTRDAADAPREARQKRRRKPAPA